jgi:hypothetical protein
MPAQSVRSVRSGHLPRSSDAVDGRRAPVEAPKCPRRHPHNTWCYNSHHCRCTKCRGAWTEARRKMYRKSRVVRREAVLVNSLPIQRRLQALAVIGYGVEEVGDMLDLHHGNLAVIRRGDKPTVQMATASKVANAYRRLWMTPSLHKNAAIISRRARALGYHSPLHWQDIDRGVQHEDSEE